MPRAAVLPAGTGDAGFRLLNDWQRAFPLEPRPWAVLGQAVGLGEQAVIQFFRDAIDRGLVSRVGAVFAPNRLGASALVAMAVPPERLDEVAGRVSAEPGVNHNYEREHHFNLWFVIAAADEAALARSIERIERDTGCAAMRLPLLEEYHIDLGFDLAGGPRRRPACAPVAAAVGPLPARVRRVLGALQEGLPLVADPYAEIARRLGQTEGAVIDAMAQALASGAIRRLGVVVRHHELGIAANAMCVWDVPDALVGDVGRRLASEAAVTLCYRRPRELPHWPYNLFCMIHGSAREAVLAARRGIGARLGLDAWPHAVLFSGRRYKQHGARYPALEVGPRRA